MTSDVSLATTLWIEAGAMSGVARNNIEFPDRLAQFFDAASRATESLDVQLRGLSFPSLLRNRGYDYGQYTEIWRLALPTRRKGGDWYAGRIIRFDRIAMTSPGTYQVTVIDIGSPVHTEWQVLAETRGVRDATGGGQGREYGFW